MKKETEHCCSKGRKKSDRGSSTRVGGDGKGRGSVRCIKHTDPGEQNQEMNFSRHLYVLCKPRFCDVKAAASCHFSFSSTFLISSKCKSVVVLRQCLLKLKGDLVQSSKKRIRVGRTESLINLCREKSQKGNRTPGVGMEGFH